MKKYQRHTAEIVWAFIGIVVLALLVLGVRSCMAPDTPEEIAEKARVTEWKSECQQLSFGQPFETETRRIGGKIYCVRKELMPDYPIDDDNAWERGCKELGGAHEFIDGGRGCFKVDMIQELGSLEDYQK